MKNPVNSGKYLYEIMDVFLNGGFKSDLPVNVVVAQGPIRRRGNASLEGICRDTLQSLLAIPADQEGVAFVARKKIVDFLLILQQNRSNVSTRILAGLFNRVSIRSSGKQRKDSGLWA